MKKEEWQIGDVPLQTEASMRAVLSEQAERVRRQSIALGFATIVVFFVVLAVAVLLGSGCSTARTGTVSENSPHLVSATLTSGSDLTESSQFVQVVLTFDQDLEANGDVSGDFQVLVNGSDPDAKVMQESAEVSGRDVTIRLVPTAAADGSKDSVYFALYEGCLSVSAASSDGALTHVLAAEGDGSSAASTCAVMDGSARWIVPSGVSIHVTQQTAGDSSSGTCAQTTFEVTQFAQLRCVTWLSLDASGQGVYDASGSVALDSDELTDAGLVLKHNHLFLRDTERGCASDLASAIESAGNGAYTAAADGVSVTVRATSAVTGQTIDPAIVEGRLADGD